MPLVSLEQVTLPSQVLHSTTEPLYSSTLLIRASSDKPDVHTEAQSCWSVVITCTHKEFNNYMKSQYTYNLHWSYWTFYVLHNHHSTPPPPPPIIIWTCRVVFTSQVENRVDPDDPDKKSAVLDIHCIQNMIYPSITPQPTWWN